MTETQRSIARVGRMRPERSLGIAVAWATLAMLSPAPPVAAQGAMPDTAVSFVLSPPASSRAAKDTMRASMAAAVPARITPAEPPPENLNSLSAWLDYKARTQIPALPEEARLFYRRGLMARESGAEDDAIQLVRGASRLDPTFALPYLTLGSWFMTREPGQAISQFASLLEVGRQSFTFQLALEANTLYAVVQAMLLALVALGMMIVVARNHALRHRWLERLSRAMPASHANVWGWAILAAPYATGLGVALPTLLFLGLLFPVLKWGERTVFVMLLAAFAAMPWVLGELDRLGSPLREDREPLYGVLRLESAASDPAAGARFAGLAAEHPDQPFVQFAHAWLSRRAGDLRTAEAAYRRALELWPEDDRVLNNLGNVLSLTGRDNEALDAYERAATRNPFNAAAHYNRARIHTARYEFRAASDAMARASALNFDLLQPYQSQIGTRDAMPPADLWIAPGRFWNALADYHPKRGEPLAVPPRWRSGIEFGGGWFSVVALLCAIAGLGIGYYQHRRLPLRYCGNCGRVVCRRCTERRREMALCRTCAAVERRAETPEHARVLLVRHRDRVRQRDRITRTGLAALIPAYGWVAHRRMFPAWLLLVALAGLVTVALDIAAPFAYEPRLASVHYGVPTLTWAVPWVVLYLISLLGYFIEAQRERARETTAPRRRPGTRRVTAQAA